MTNILQVHTFKLMQYYIAPYLSLSFFTMNVDQFFLFVVEAFKIFSIAFDMYVYLTCIFNETLTKLIKIERQ